MPTVGTLAGWAAILGLGAGWYWASSGKQNKQPGGKHGAKATEPPKEQKEPKSKKVRKDGRNHDSSDNAKSSKIKKIAGQHATVKEAPAVDRRNVEVDKDDDVDDRDFARQLQNAKTGTLSSAKAPASTKQRSVKQNRAKENVVAEASSDNATAPSSTTGGDADDDQSPVNSPDLNATAVASLITNGISDMLEQPAAGPSVLRVTAPTNAAPKKAKVPPKLEPVETKKQRQNRKKAEAKRLARDEDEKERGALMEKQRRTAREAEGRAAKDGSAFMAAKAPANSAWTGSQAAPTVNGGNMAHIIQPLDTYEPSASTSSISKPASSLSEDEMSSESQLFGSKQPPFMSEEEQIELAKESTAEWEVVKTKERKNKAAHKESKNSKEEAQSSTDEQQDHNPPKKTRIAGSRATPIAQTKNGHTNGKIGGDEWAAGPTHKDKQAPVEAEAEWEVS